MKKPAKTAPKSLMSKMKELGQKHGVKVTDLSERGVRAIGIIGGIPNPDKIPLGGTNHAARIRDVSHKATRLRTIRLTSAVCFPKVWMSEGNN